MLSEENEGEEGQSLHAHTARRKTGMSAHLTLGIEEEFQIVDRRTGQLSPSILTIIEKGAPYFGSKIKPEMLQSTIELITDVLPNIAAPAWNCRL